MRYDGNDSFPILMRSILFVIAFLQLFECQPIYNKPPPIEILQALTWNESCIHLGSRSALVAIIRINQQSLKQSSRTRRNSNMGMVEIVEFGLRPISDDPFSPIQLTLEPVYGFPVADEGFESRPDLIQPSSSFEYTGLPTERMITTVGPFNIKGKFVLWMMIRFDGQVHGYYVNNAYIHKTGDWIQPELLDVPVVFKSRESEASGLSIASSMVHQHRRIFNPTAETLLANMITEHRDLQQSFEHLFYTWTKGYYEQKWRAVVDTDIETFKSTQQQYQEVYGSAVEYCSICLERLVDKENPNDKISMTECMHFFHEKCFIRGSCPICETPLKTLVG